MNVYLPYTRLPSTYQEVEYIQSSGTQYIHTEIVPTDTIGLYMKVSSQNTSSDTVYCGSNSDATDQASQKFGLGNSGNTLYFGWNTWQPAPGSRPATSTNTIVELENNYLNSRCMKKDGTNIVTNLGTLSSNGYGINIFGHNGRGTAQFFSSIQLYSFKVSNGTTVVNDFIPCYRKSDGVIGLYDLVNSVFYTNQGTGTFSKGSDVTMSELKNAYIGEYYHIQTFDFQNDGSLNWTAQTIYGTPSYTSGQGWTIGSSTSTYQSAIMPPSSIYSGTLYKVKIWFYKSLATGSKKNAGAGLATPNFTNGLTSWCQPSGTSTNTYANVYDGSDHLTQTIDITGEVIQEWNLNDDGSITLSLNGGTPYNLGNYATLFRNNRSNKILGLSIGRWDYSAAPYIRKVEITTI